MKTLKNIGLIGLGNIGGNMAKNLLDQGFGLYLYDTDAKKMEALISAGAVGCDSIQDLVTCVDLVMTSLPGPKQLEAVMLSDAGVLAHAPEGLIWIDTGTNSIDTMQRMAEEAKKQGIAAITAPVSGGSVAAEAGTLSIFVGGDQGTFEAIKPLLEIVGSQIFYVGDYINAPLMKLLINYLCLVNAKAIGEVLSVANEAGIDLQQLASVVQSSTGNSWVMETLVPPLLAGGPGPGFSLALAYKDAQLVDELNTAYTTPLAFSQHLSEAFAKACAIHGGQKSFAEMIRVSKQSS